MAHLHDVKDSDNHYRIEPVTMAISNANDAKNKLMLGDHDSEIYTFEIPKVVEGHDMSLCDMVEVHFVNIAADKANRSVGVYTVKDMAVAEDAEDTLVFTWKVSGEATVYAGSLNYRIKFACRDENGNYTYKKWTDVYKGITVADGFDNAAAVEKEHSDILAEWGTRLDALEQGGCGGGSVASIGYATLLGSMWVGNASPYSQVVSIEGVTENSQVDLTPSVEQLAIFYEKDLAFVTENEGGVVTVYAIGQKPQNDYTIQVTITEVLV